MRQSQLFDGSIQQIKCISLSKELGTVYYQSLLVRVLSLQAHFNLGRVIEHNKWFSRNILASCFNKNLI